MSFCPIDNNEDLLKVYKYVRTALEKQIVEKKPVDVKAIANKLYNSVLARTKDQAKALSYAHLVPGLVRQAYGASQKVSDYFLDTNYSVDDAARLERSWREKPLEKVAEYLGLNQDLAKAAESAEQVVATEKQIESSNEQNAPSWIIVRDYALPSTLFATTGQEAQTDEENRIPENNVKDPEMAMYYKVQRALVSNPNYPGIKGQAHLTMMAMSRLPVRKMYPKTQRETENNPDLAKGYDKVFIQTVTDSEGNIIYFDQEGNVTTKEQGMPVYFPVRLSLEQVQEPKTDEEAATLKKQEAYLGEMIDYISSNPNSNQIISAITGGSLGFLDSSKALVPLTQLSKSLYPTIEFRVDESGAPFMRVPRYQQDVAIIMNNFSEDVARNIARLLLNDVVRGGQKLTTTQKASLLFPYLAPSTTTGLGFNSKSKEYFLNGKPIAQASEEEIVKALTETKDSQGNIVPSRYVYKNTAKNINKFSVKESNGVFTLSENIVPYSQFVTENASVGKKIEGGDFTPFNSYLNFLPTGKFVAAALGVEETTKTKPEVAELFDSNPELASVGTPEQYSQYLNTKDTPIVYHGSPEYFEKFDISKLGSYTGAASAKEGIFFGGSRDVSRSYLDKRGDTLNVDSLIKQKPELRLQSSDEIGRYYYEEDIEDYDTIYHTVVIYIDGTVLDSSDEYGDVYTDIDNYDLSQLESPEETKKKDIKWAEESVEWYKKIVEKNPGRENELLSAEKQLENSKNAELAPKPTKNILSKLIDPSKRSIIKAKIKFTDQLEKRTKHLKDTYDSDAGVYIDKDRSITDKPFENLFIRPFTLKLKNPLIVSDKGEKYREETYFERIQKAKELGHDGLIIKDTYDSRYQTKPEDVYVVFDSDVITELGSKQDIEGFKKFVQQTTTKETSVENKPTQPAPTKSANLPNITQQTLFRIFEKAFYEANDKRTNDISKQTLAKLSADTRKYLLNLYEKLKYYDETFQRTGNTKDNQTNKINVTDDEKIIHVTSSYFGGFGRGSHELGSAGNPRHKDLVFPMPSIEVLANINDAFNAQIEDLVDLKSQKAQEAIKNSDIQNSSKSAKDILDNIADNLNDPDIFNMLDTQKKRNLAATREQLSQAIPWYMSLTLPDGRKLSDIIPLTLAFNAVNMTSAGVATWTKAGITLWKGADTSDLYHEAWHGFSQVFLTNAQREELYNQVRKKKGSFSDYMGNEVKYSEANKLQAEEWLAEQFREHMLRGGKGQYEKSKKSVIAKIFDAIYTALQHLFGGSSTRETLADAKADKNISDMFEKLRVGDLSTPNFEIEASFSEGLNKIKATRKEDPVQILSNAESHLAFATIDSIMSDAVDELNAKAKIAGKATAPYTLGILTDLKTRKSTYNYVQKTLQDKLNALNERASKTSRVPAQLKKKIDLLTWMINNFGESEYAQNGLGVIGEYEKLRFSAYTEESDQQDITSRSEYADKSGNEIASINLADPKLLSVMSSIRKYDSEEDFKKNKPVLNDLGFAELEDKIKVFNELSNLTEGSKNAIEVYNTLKKLASSNYIVSQFLNKVGSPLEVKTELENSMWGSIEKILTMPRVNVVNLDVEIQREKVTRKDDAGNETQVTTKKIAKVTVKPGEASRETTKVYNKMQSQFSSNETAYIKRNPKTGRNYLDTEALMKEFNRNYPTRIFEFLEAMGVTMPNVEAVRNGLQDKATGYPEMIKGLAMKLNTINRFNADRIKEGNSKDIIVIENVNDIFNDLTNPNYKTGYNLGASNTIKKELGKFYLRWTGDFSNSTVTTTMGKTKYERSNPNTITKMADSLNDGMNFQDVVQDTDVVQNTANGTISRMNHLSTERTPWSKVSLLLDELYDMKSAEKFRRIVTVGGEKLVQARINILDMDGSKIRDEEFEIAGIKSSISDPTTKFLQDFYMNLVYGTSEAVRHAGKSSTFLYQIVRAREGVKSQSKHYFEPSDFRSDNMGISPGRSKVLGAMRGYLAAEFERIHKAKTEESAKDKLLYRKSGKIVTLADTGSKFQMFDDILTADQKTELLKLQDKDITTVEQFLEHLDSNVKLLNDIDTQLNSYLDKLVNESIALLDASGAMDSPYLFRAITNKIMKPGEKFSDLNPADVKRSLIEAFTFNQYIHNVETGIVFYGDPALYNHLKEEFHKRNAGIGSTGEIPRTGVDFQNFVNNKRGSYSKSKWYTGPAVEQRAYDGTFRSSVFADKVTKSEYLKEYTKAAIDAETTRLKSLNASQEQINKAEEVIKKRFDEAYGAMKEGDAQGWITLDSYRLLMKSLNKWDTNVHEKLYNKILAGEEVSALDVAKFFPVKKMQYWGPLATDGLPVYAFHKFSLMPLVPTVIKGTKLEQLHNKMVEQQIDYSLFESGSKIATIGTNGKFDNFLDNETRKLSINDPEYKFTPNVVFADYMKDQTEVAPEYKGKVTFSTQLRKLVEEGIIENGVPIDFEPQITDKQTRVEEWRKVEDKEGESKLWKKVKTYESKLALLTAKLKQQLVREVGWTEQTNTPDLKKLLDFVEKQLSRQEIADNELEFINDLKTSPNVNFDLSSYRGQIEKLLTAVVNKRLIRQKVNGEALIQVSGAGFEAAGKFANATEADIEKYGSNDLPFYKQDAAGTKAMKVKVALQGQFKKLLNLKEVAELSESEGISKTDALNRLIKDEAWLSEGNNRKMITMMGVRIPVQGLNSMEFMEVYEFLPEEAGNIIIPPAEIVAKSGSDFDIDKMTIQMPNISQKVNKAKLTSKFLNELQEANPDLDFSKDNVNIILDAAEGTDGVYTLTPEDQEILNILESKTDFEISLPTDDISIKGLENGLMYASIDLISDPANFVSLVTPNGTDIAKPISEDLGKMTREYSSRNKFASKDKGFSATRIYEPLYNIYKLDYNAVGKAALGLGAVDNTYNTIFNRIGAYLSDVTQISTTEGQTKKERNPYYLTNRILMPHNTINGKISLSHMYDVNNENKISDVFSQLINGWVDVEKDEWIFDLQGNKELAPILLLLVQSGVSLEQAALFVSQPMIREYVKDSKLRRGTFAPLIDKESDENQHAVDARNNILFLDPKFGFIWDPQSMTSQSSFTGKPDKWQIFNAIKELVSDADASLFTKEALKKNIENFNSTQKYTKEDRKAFMHFLELEQMSKGLTEIKLAMNYDTTRSGSLFEARAKLEKENKAAKERGFDKEVFEAIIANSPIGSFKVQDFMLELWEPFFPVTSSPAMNNYLSEENIGRYIARGTSFAGDPEGAIESFRSQIIPFLFQNDYYSFKIGKVYRGREIDGEFALKRAEFLRRGALYQDGKIYYDTATVNETFNNKDYSSSASNIYRYFLKNNVAPLQPNIFSGFNDVKAKELYQRFLLERESLRGSSDYNFDTVSKTKEYKRILSQMKDLYRSHNKDLFKAEMEMTEETPDETRKEIETKVKDANATAAVWAYETYLRNAAMDNMNLPSHLFHGSNSYADQFMNIKKAFPTLSKYYPVMEALDKNSSNDKNPIINLVLRDSRLTKDQKDLYAENIAELSDASTIKDKFANISMEDAVDIAKFFSRFTTYAYIQGATTPKSTFNVLSIANPSEIGKMLMPSVNNFISLIDKVEGMQVGETPLQELILDSYLKAFKKANPSKKTSASKRYKIFDDPNFRFYADPNMSDKAIKDFVEATTPKKKEEVQPSQQQASVKAKGFKLSIDKKGKDQGKADLANALITYPNSGTSSYQYMQDAKKQGFPVNNEIKAGPDVIAMVSVNGNNKATDKQIEDTYLAAREIIEAGGTVIMDSTIDANRSWNASGEALVQEQLGEPTGQTSKGYNYWGKNPEVTQQQTSVSTNQQVVSEPYGVVVAETKPSADKTQDFVDLIQPQIRAQAYKENASGTANDMFMYGLRWTRKSTAKAPLNNKSYANKGLPITDAKAKDTYVYDTLDQNGNPLAPVSDLQPIITEIQNALGIDMSNYDAVIGNIYLPGQNIATHRDTTESLSARNYPVVVYTIGNNSGIGIYEDKNNPGSPSFASNSRKEIPTQNGTIYTFGMDGKGRFELAHDTPKGVKRDQKFPPITLPNGTVVENYTITLTFRRAADLEAGMPTSPAKIGKVNTTNQQIASQPVATPVTTVLGMGKQQRTGVPTFSIPGVKAKDDKVGTVESKTFNQTNINAIKEANPNTIFIGSGIAIKPGATTRNTTGYAGSNTTLVQLGPGSYGSIPYKYLPNVYKKDGTLIPNSIMTDETYDDNIQVIEDAIQQIVENLGDKDVVLDANGYGQELLGRDPLSPSTIILDKSPAPKTFVYLSKRLYEEFGFINPNSLGSNTIVNTVQSNQRVNELELFNKLKNEALSCSI